MINLKILKKILLIILIFAFFIPKSIFAAQYKEIDRYQKNNLTIISYSKSWKNSKLVQLYEELLKNFHSEELEYLSKIYIYPDSPLGINGLYIEDIEIKNGTYSFGKNSYISLYNGEKFNSISEIAPILAHEYGHHYSMFNMLKTEGIYYNDFENSKYAKLRNIKNFPLYHLGDAEGQKEYHWDLLEIMADDYVQLLGSPNAKLSKDYKSSDELANNKRYNNSGIYFNLKPSINPYIPLASEVEGLYNYFLEIGGYTAPQPKLKKEPVLSNISVSKALNKEPSYKISWTEAIGKGPFEYTLIMYPTSNPFSPIPLKTVKTGEKLEAIFGSYVLKNKIGTSTISRRYQGEFKIKLYIEDKPGFIYETKPIIFNF